MATPPRRSAGATASVAPGTDGGPDPEWRSALNEALTTVSRRTRSPALHREMARRARLDVSPYLLDALFRIRTLQPVRVSDVAEGTGYDRSTISRHVAELVDNGLLTRERDPADGRAVVVKLSSKGRRAVTKIEQQWFDVIDAITDDWTDDDRAHLLELLDRFNGAFARALGNVVD